MKLYTVQVAPNPTRVNLYIAEKNAAGIRVDLSQQFMNLMKGEQKQPEHLARNPFGALPVLEVTEGRFILESLAIIEYLEERFPEPPLIGADIETRARVRQLERIVELRVLQPIGRLIHATNSPLGLPPSPEVAEQARAAMPIGLQYIEDCLADAGPFVAGEQVSIADCTLAATLQFGRFRKVEIDTQYTNILRWDAMYREREPAKSVLVM